MNQANQMSMSSPTDLFIHELSDMYSAEQIIVQMLRSAQEMVRTEQLMSALRTHEEQTRQHVTNLERVFNLLGQQPHPVTCHAMMGMQQELMEGQQSGASPDVLEGLVVGGAEKTEAYEITAYSGLRDKARASGHTDVARLIEQNLMQEEETLRLMQAIAAEKTQQMAAYMREPRGRAPM